MSLFLVHSAVRKEHSDLLVDFNHDKDGKNALHKKKLLLHNRLYIVGSFAKYKPRPNACF
jgi:hypothetical protein